MRNRVISCSLRGFEVFPKEPVIISIRFFENDVLGVEGKYISIYISISGVGGGEIHGSPYISCLQFI